MCKQLSGFKGNWSTAGNIYFIVTCPIPGYTYNQPTGQCIKHHTTLASFEAAEASCEAEGAKLASVKSSVEHGVIKGKYNNFHIKYYFF